jgi:Flp pilus assembly protein TadG
MLPWRSADKHSPRRGSARTWLKGRWQLLRTSSAHLQRGVAMVEFALVVTMFIPMIVVFMELGMAFNYKNQLTQMASQGARWAAVNKNPGPGATLQESILATAVGPELKQGGTAWVDDPAQVCITPGTGKGDAVTVTANVNYNWLPLKLPFLPGSSGTVPAAAETAVGGSSRMMLEQTPTAYAAGCSS